MKKRYLSVLALVFLLQFTFISSSSAFSFDKIGSFLDEVSGGLDRISATLDKAIGGPTEDNQRVIDKAKKQSPETTAFLGKWEDKWEKSSGEKTHESLRRDPGFLTDKSYLSKVSTIARRLVKQVDRKELTFHFAVLDQKEVNAFAAPGGYIYVTKGLMDAVESDDELAGVIAHELGHIDKKHSVKAAEKKGIMMLLVAGLGLNKKSEKYAKYAAIASYFADLKFSRKDEYEADSCAVKYTAAAGYNPAGIVDFFHRIDTGSKSAKFTKYFSTHPPTPDRIKAVEKLISKLPTNSSASQAAVQNTSVTSNTNATSNTSSSNATVPTSNTSYGNSNTSQKPTSRQLKVSYESYLYYKQLYQFKVQEQAPTSEILEVFGQYQDAKKRYMELRKAAGY